MTLLYSTSERSGAILPLGINILTNLYQQLYDVTETSYRGVVQSCVAKLISLESYKYLEWIRYINALIQLC